MKPLICIPTYNERENIQALVPQIFSIAPEVSILVIEDNSPDGTGEVVKELMKEYPKLSCLHRTGKQGLASAYLAGFREGIRLGYDCMFSMDADFSHDPKHLPEFLRLIKEYDFVIGSRYIDNGGTKNWGIGRKIISRGGNVYANVFLHTPFKDLTGGFNCFRKEVLQKILSTKVITEGYSFQIELKYRCVVAGFKGVETPIMFEDRKVGQSKMSSRIFLEAIKAVPTFPRKVSF